MQLNDQHHMTSRLLKHCTNIVLLGAKRTPENVAARQVAHFYLGLEERDRPVRDGDHSEVCAVCNTELEWYNYESSYGDAAVADCDECGTSYGEGYIQGNETDVPTLQLAYLNEVITNERDRVPEIEEWIRDQLGLPNDF